MKMCKAIDDMIQEGRDEGRIEGIISAYKEIEIPREDAIMRLKKRFQLSEEEAESTMQKYWNA